MLVNKTTKESLAWATYMVELFNFPASSVDLKSNEFRVMLISTLL